MPRKRKETPDGYDEKFPQRLRELIKEKGETQQGLAEYIRRTRQTVSYYCDGSSSPEWKTLGQIAQYFGVTSDYLIGLSDAKQPENSDITDRLGLSEEAIEIIQDYFKASSFSNEDEVQSIPRFRKEYRLTSVLNDLIVRGADTKCLARVCDLRHAMDEATSVYEVESTLTLEEIRDRAKNERKIREDARVANLIVLPQKGNVDFLRQQVKKEMDLVLSKLLTPHEDQYNAALNRFEAHYKSLSIQEYRERKADSDANN